jgi:hypothetical protein
MKKTQAGRAVYASGTLDQLPTEVQQFFGTDSVPPGVEVVVFKDGDGFCWARKEDKAQTRRAKRCLELCGFPSTEVQFEGLHSFEMHLTAKEPSEIDTATIVTAMMDKLGKPVVLRQHGGRNRVYRWELEPTKIIKISTWEEQGTADYLFTVILTDLELEAQHSAAVEETLKAA